MVAKTPVNLILFLDC